jgi:GNAT superfamily N-acetyltransferase
MKVVRITPTDSASLDAFAQVMVDAFATEDIHSYIFDFARGGTRQTLVRAARVELESYAGVRDHVLVAVMGGRVVGGAMVSRNARRPVRRRMFQGLRWLLAAVPLAPAVRWRRLRRLHTATGLSRPVVGEHYTLAALTVHPDFQGRGIGSALLDEVHRLSELDPGVIGVYLYTGARKNQLMYERKGYQTIEARQTEALTVYHMFRTNGGSFVTVDSSD